MLGESKEESVTALGARRDGKYLVAGYESGSVSVHDLKKDKAVSGNMKVHDGSVVDVQFLSGAELEIVSLGKDKVLRHSAIKISSKKTGLDASISTVVLMKDCEAHCVCPVFVFSPLVAVSDSYSILLLDPKNGGETLDRYDYPASLAHAQTCLAFSETTTVPYTVQHSRVLALSRGASLTFLGLNPTFHVLGHCHVSQPLAHIAWIEDNHLVALEGGERLVLVYTGGVAKGKASSEVVKLGSFEVEGGFCGVSSVRRSVVWMGREKVVVGRMCAWFDFLNEISVERHMYGSVLKTVFRMRAGEVKGFASLAESMKERESDLKEWLKSYVQQYFFFAVQLKESIQENLELAAQIFLLVFNEKEFITETLRKDFHDAKMSKQFIKALEPYIMFRCFKHEKVPEEFISSIIECYEETKEYILLENALIQTVSPENDLDYLSMVCQRHRLYTGYIHICTMRSEPMYYDSPLLVMWSNLRFMDGAKDEFELGDVYSEKVLWSKGYLRYRILWYVDMCLKGVDYSSRAIVNNYAEIVTAVLACVVEEKMLKELIQFDPKTVLNEVFLQIFIEDELRSLFETLLRSKRPARAFDLELFLREISKVVEELEGRREVFEQYIIFRSSALAAPGTPNTPELTFVEARMLPLYSHTLPSSIELMVLSHLKLLNRIPPEVVEELEVLYKDSEYVEVWQFLMEERKKYVELLDVYVKHKPKKVFSWLEEMSVKLKGDAAEYAKLKGAIIDRIELLVLFA